jgi:hypothetical protein
METRFQSFDDPYFCIEAMVEEGRWYIVDRILIDIP